MMDESKIKQLDAFVSDARKIFGEGSLFLPKLKPLSSVEWVSTGIYSIDGVFGGGIPRGRILEIFGPEASGKTTMCLELIKAMQRAEYLTMFIDVEHSLDPEYARRIGVDIDNMLISQPNSAEEALELLKTACERSIFGLVVVDSVAGLVPQAEIDGEIGDKHMALQAQLMSQSLRQLAGIVKRTNTTIIFTNQIRFKVGVFFGSPETQPGGNALKFYASIRVDIRKRDVIKEGEQFKGIVTRVKIVKNKVAPPFKEAMINVLFNKGIDKGGDIRDQLLVSGRLVCRGGNYYIDGNTRIGSGKVNADKWLLANYKQYEKDKGGWAIIEAEMRKEEKKKKKKKLVLVKEKRK